VTFVCGFGYCTLDIDCCVYINVTEIANIKKTSVRNVYFKKMQLSCVELFSLPSCNIYNNYLQT
jgi:hypothetical protein